MASTSRRLLKFLCFVLAVVSWTSRASVSAVRVDGIFTFNNTYCSNFWVELTCVYPILEDGFNGFKLAFFNHDLKPKAYTLSVVWVAYPSTSEQYQRAVWSANRNRPVGAGAWVTFVPNGSLALYDTDGTEAWSTRTDGMGAMGLGLDGTRGELILYDDHNQTIWSSFWFPTDSIVAGQQLALGQRLVGDNSSFDKSEGPYSLVMEPAGLALYVSLADPQPYFVWNYFAQSQEPMPVSSLFTTCHNPVTLELSGNGEMALSLPANTSSLDPSSLPDTFTSSEALCNLSSNYSSIKMASYPNTANLSYVVLENDGSLGFYEFHPSGTQDDSVILYSYKFFEDTQCDLPQICGAYGVCKGNGQCECPSISSVAGVADPGYFVPNSFSPNSSQPNKGCFYSGGPLETTCNASAQEHMGRVEGMDYYSNKFLGTGITTSMADCINLCLDNCSCIASFYNSKSGACHSVSQPLLSMTSTTNSPLTAFVKVNGVAPTPNFSRTRKLAIWIGVGVSNFVLFFVVVLGLVRFSSRRKARRAQSKEDEFLETLPGLPPRYSKKELDGATMGFTKELGYGGFGTVYEGTLKDGSKIAVKKLQSSKSTKNFRAEMATLGSIHHINLVRLKGFCAEGVENMLVYEYLPNGSLDGWLFNSDPKSASFSKLLDWETRFKIAVGIARGLAYLHDDCSERIIHMDIKPSNILLDLDFNSKVGDFGLSTLMHRDVSTVVTTIRGTPGYLAPEWLLQGAITEKSDVYSYGVVLLEMVAGRKCRDFSKQEPRQQYLPAWLIWCVLQGNPLEIVDPRLDVQGREEQITKVIHIALHCIQADSTERPSMEDVVQMLEGLVSVPHLQRASMCRKYRFLDYPDLNVIDNQSLDFGTRDFVSSEQSVRVNISATNLICPSSSPIESLSLSSRSSFHPVSPESRSVSVDSGSIGPQIGYPFGPNHPQMRRGECSPFHFHGSPNFDPHPGEPLSMHQSCFHESCRPLTSTANNGDSFVQMVLPTQEHTAKTSR